MDENVKNPFATEAGAVRYQAGRPFHHPRALARIMDIIGNKPIPCALDIACGTNNRIAHSMFRGTVRCLKLRA